MKETTSWPDLARHPGELHHGRRHDFTPNLCETLTLGERRSRLRNCRNSGSDAAGPQTSRTDAFKTSFLRCLVSGLVRRCAGSSRTADTHKSDGVSGKFDYVNLRNRA